MAPCNYGFVTARLAMGVLLGSLLLINLLSRPTTPIEQRLTVNIGLVRFARFIGSNYSLFTFCYVHGYCSLGSKQKVVGIYQNLVGIYQK